jgi:hypothetical protein
MGINLDLATYSIESWLLDRSSIPADMHACMGGHGRELECTSRRPMEDRHLQHMTLMNMHVEIEQHAFHLPGVK